MNKRYKVWFSRGNVFDTLEMATKYANLVYFYDDYAILNMVLKDNL